MFCLLEAPTGIYRSSSNIFTTTDASSCLSNPVRPGIARKVPEALMEQRSKSRQLVKQCQPKSLWRSQIQQVFFPFGINVSKNIVTFKYWGVRFLREQLCVTNLPQAKASAQINQSYLGHSGRSHALKDDKDSYFVVFKNYHKATPKLKLDTTHIE